MAESVAPDTSSRGGAVDDSGIRSLSLDNRMRGVIVTSVVRGGGLFLTLLTGAILSRTLTPADFGRFGLLTSLLLVLCCIARFGLERTVVRYAAKFIADENAEAYRHCFRTGYATATITTLSVLFVWVALTLSCSELVLGFELSTMAICSFSIMLASGSLLMLASESFRVTQNNLLANLTMAETSSFTIAALHLLFLGIICWNRQNTLDQSLASLAVSMLIPSVVAVVWLPRAIKTAEPKTGSKAKTTSGLDYMAFLSAGGVVMIIQTVTNMTLTCDYWFVERYCTPDELGRFAAAKRLVNLSAIPMSLASTAAAASIALLQAQRKRGELQSLLRRIVCLGAIPSLVFLGILVLFAHDLLEAYYGSGYGTGSNILRILVVGYSMLAIVGAAEMALVMSGHLRTTFSISLCSFIFLVVGCQVFSAYGTEGVCWVFTAVLAGRSILMCLAFGLLTGSWSNLDITYLLRSRLKAGAGND